MSLWLAAMAEPNAEALVALGAVDAVVLWISRVMLYDNHQTSGTAAGSARTVGAAAAAASAQLHGQFQVRGRGGVAVMSVLVLVLGRYISHVCVFLRMLWYASHPQRTSPVELMRMWESLLGVLWLLCYRPEARRQMNDGGVDVLLDLVRHSHAVYATVRELALACLWTSNRYAPNKKHAVLEGVL